MPVVITRIGDDLPEGVDELAAVAAGEGITNVTVLLEAWRGGAERFAAPGALFAAWRGGELAGIGGLTVQEGLGEAAMRMRRLYVAPGARREGVGRALASAMIQQGFDAADLLTCNARASAAAPLFWEDMGFTRAPDLYDFTHWLRRTG